MNNIEKFFNQIQVYDCDLTKVRIGNKADGGYIALEELCACSTELYSFGIGDDVGFELDWAERFPMAAIHLFDPTIDQLPEEHTNFTFFKKSIHCAHNALSRASGSSTLKLDVECNEWEALARIPIQILCKFDQILVEFHIVHAEPREDLSPYFNSFYRSVFDSWNDRAFSQYSAVLEKLSKAFYIFHIHSNNSLPVTAIGDRIFPPLLEVSFVRKDLVDAKKSNASFPIYGLDYPNKPDRPDVSLDGIA